MKTIILAVASFLVILLGAKPASAQAPEWQAVAGALAQQVTNCNASVTATAADNNGNVYLVGSFVGPVALGLTTLNDLGAGFMFVAKWSSLTRSFVWVMRPTGASRNNLATAIAVSGNSIYIAGSYSGAISFGSTSLPDPGTSGLVTTTDMFVAKLTDFGNSAEFVWAQRGGGARFETVNALAVQGSDVFVAGSFSSPSATFGATTLLNPGFTPPNTYSDDIFVAKLTDAGSTGSFVWAQRAGGLATDGANALAVSGANVYIAGNVGSAPAFGSIPATPWEAYVAKLTDAGTTASFTWVRQSASTFNAPSISALAVQGQQVYAAGWLYGNGAASFGPVTVSNTTAENDACLIRLIDTGPTGTFTWAQTLGGANHDFARSLVATPAAVYVVGTFRSPTLAIGGTTLVNASASGTSGDVFVAKLTTTGTTPAFEWARQGGGPGDDEGNTLAVGGAAMYVGGSFIGTTSSFGSLTLTSPANSRSGFLSQLTDPTLLPTAPATALATLMVYPNPAHSSAAVRVPAVPGASRVTLTLLDQLGRVVRTESVALPAGGIRTELPLQGLAPGLYHLRVSAGQQHRTLSLAVE